MTRTAERLEALGCILSDGLSYSWFLVEALDSDAVTATVRYDGPKDDEGTFSHVAHITADDVARGLRMYREWLEGKREGTPGQWERAANGNEFCRAEGVRVPASSYGWELVKFDRTNGAEGDYDADTADTAMQFAILGHNIYG